MDTQGLIQALYDASRGYKLPTATMKQIEQKKLWAGGKPTKLGDAVIHGAQQVGKLSEDPPKSEEPDPPTSFTPETAVIPHKGAGAGIWVYVGDPPQDPDPKKRTPKHRHAQIVKALRQDSRENGSPLRVPHHTVSVAGLRGEGKKAAGGVLLLDDAQEFRRRAMDEILVHHRENPNYRLVLIVEDSNAAKRHVKQMTDARVKVRNWLPRFTEPVPRPIFFPYRSQVASTPAKPETEDTVREDVVHPTPILDSLDDKLLALLRDSGKVSALAGSTDGRRRAIIRSEWDLTEGAANKIIAALEELYPNRFDLNARKPRKGTTGWLVMARRLHKPFAETPPAAVAVEEASRKAEEAIEAAVEAETPVEAVEAADKVVEAAQKVKQAAVEVQEDKDKAEEERKIIGSISATSVAGRVLAQKRWNKSPHPATVFRRAAKAYCRDGVTIRNPLLSINPTGGQRGPADISFRIDSSRTHKDGDLQIVMNMPDLYAKGVGGRYVWTLGDVRSLGVLGYGSVNKLLQRDIRLAPRYPAGQPYKFTDSAGFTYAVGEPNIVESHKGVTTGNDTPSTPVVVTWQGTRIRTLDNPTPKVAKAATKTYRSKHPSSRVVSPFRYAVNTGVRKRRECIFCGEEGPGWATAYPRTVQSIRWEEEHECKPLLQAAGVSDNPSPEVAAAATKAYRKQHPSSRVVSPFRYAVNTGVRKRRECIFCGEEGPGWATAYPRTVQSIRWEEEHECKPLLQAAVEECKLMADNPTCSRDCEWCWLPASTKLGQSVAFKDSQGAIFCGACGSYGHHPQKRLPSSFRGQCHACWRPIEGGVTNPSGYCPCACRDCFETAIGGDDDKAAFCWECEEAGCELDGECQAPGAYGADEWDNPADKRRTGGGVSIDNPCGVCPSDFGTLEKDRVVMNPEKWSEFNDNIDGTYLGGWRHEDKQVKRRKALKKTIRWLRRSKGLGEDKAAQEVWARLHQLANVVQDKKKTVAKRARRDRDWISTHYEPWKYQNNPFATPGLPGGNMSPCIGRPDDGICDNPSELIIAEDGD